MRTVTLRSVIIICFGSLFGIPFSQSFSPNQQHSNHHIHIVNQDEANDNNQRRRLLNLLVSSATTPVALLLLGTPSTPANADTGAEVRGTAVTPFNALAFQYRGTDFPGLKQEDIHESSISYSEFIEKMKNNQVEFVEFMAPNGDVAYVTLKDSNSSSSSIGGRIRIGEGYPIEQPDGYSSPAFAVRAVQNAGVPYKFIVPALASSSRKKNSN